MIPRTIHQIWISEAPPKPFLTKCVKSVKHLHPHWTYRLHRDFTAMYDQRLGELGETSPAFCFDVLGKLGGRGPHSVVAMQTDILRLVLLYLHGGIYLDIDMWSIRRLDSFVRDKLVLMRITPAIIGEGLIGAEARSDDIKDIIEWYMRQPNVDGYVSMNLEGLALERGWNAYGSDYFCPHTRTRNDNLYRMTSVTHTIHCWKEHIYHVPRLRRMTQIANGQTPTGSYG